MKITGVEGIILRLPERQAVADGTQDDLLIRIETDEGITGYGEVDTSPEVGKAVVNAEMSHVGGLTEAKRIVYLAQEVNRLCVPHAFRTGVLVAACLHLIAAIPNSAFLEFSVTDSALRRELLVEPFKVVHGQVAVPTKPGLGIEINADTLKAYAV
jgi:L-alanine-DL-glutamate epimerase-like enolase superfamily enzyme